MSDTDFLSAEPGRCLSAPELGSHWASVSAALQLRALSASKPGGPANKQSSPQGLETEDRG